ncbi:protein kinase [Streptomyces sp. NPDC048389]|uniref:protein kinase domain-containing protein n=1 Tax=Streptomyces sp. NPDC048389 TaxID=3154622 RepID=UPI00345543FE
MSEAEQSREPQRGVGFADGDADSAAGAEAGSAGGGAGSGSDGGASGTAASTSSPKTVREDEGAVAGAQATDVGSTDRAEAPGPDAAVSPDAAEAVPSGVDTDTDAPEPGASDTSAARGDGDGAEGLAGSDEDRRARRSVTKAQDGAEAPAAAGRKVPSPRASGSDAPTAAAAGKDSIAADDVATPDVHPSAAAAVKSAAVKPAAVKPAAEKPAAGKSADVKPAAVKSAEEKPPAVKATSADQPAGSGSAVVAPTGTKGRGATGSEGRLVAGRYRLGGVLGRGGMGTVWRAVDETLGRTVAVKELRFPGSVDDDEKRRLITRTLREAKAIARIRNNSAVTVYDVVDEDDRPWIVMELVEGKSLAEVVREDGTLTPRRAAEVGLAILDVLRSAHREGILHRDVKPSNVLIGRDGRVVLTDFGIAQVEGDPSITSTGMLVGAPSYISPERARGHKPGPAADLWSLGGLLYASVEGSPPYDKGSAIATLTAVMTEPLDPPKNAGPLEEVIYGLLAKDPAQRLDDAGARALLTRVVNAPEAPEPPAAPEPSPEATRAVRLPAVPPEPPAAAPSVPKDPAADRLRGALRSVRNAAAAVKAESKQPAPDAPTRRPARARAPLTDVVPRRTLVIIAVVAVLAVLSTVLVFALGRDDDAANQGKGQGKDDTAASAGATAGGGEDEATAGAGSDASPDSGDGTAKGDDAGEEESDGGTDSPEGRPSGEPKGDDTVGGGTLPTGYVMVSNDRWHFTMAMPKNLRLTGVAGQNSGGKFSVDGGTPRVQVDFNNSPKDDAAAAWAAAVAGVSATSNGYKHLGIGPVQYNGYPTVADWKFERNERGERVRILNRGFKVDAKRGYSIMITCRVSEWDGEACRTLRETAFATFSPKD